MCWRNKMMLESCSNVSRKNFSPCKLIHQHFIFLLPFFAVRRNGVSKFLPCYQVRHLMNKSDEESILIQITIHRNAMTIFSLRPAIVTKNTLTRVSNSECDFV